MPNPQDAIDKKQCESFFELLFQHDVIENMYFIILLIHPTEMREDGNGFITKTAGFKPENITKAVDYCMQHRSEWNVFVGVNPMSRMPEYGRGKILDVGAITSFFADVDVANPLRNDKKVYARDMETAQKIIEDVGLKPTLILNSGYGLQGYWILKEPWEIEDSSERTELHTKSKAWGATVNSVAEMHKSQIDAANDITRVLRVPGTYNLKDPKNPQPVRAWAGYDLIQDKGRRLYTLDDFEPYYVAVDLKVPLDHKRIGQVAPVIPEKVFTKEEEELMDAMVNTSPTLRLTWAGNNPNLDDQSPSAYDLSLATCLYDLNAEPQFIANAMFTLRSKMGWNTDKVLNRRDYVQRTIAKAMFRTASQNAIAKISRGDLKIQQGVEVIKKNAMEANDGDEAAGMDAVTDARQEAIDTLSAALEIKIIKFIQMGIEDGNFFMEVEHWGKLYRINLGTISSLATPRKMRQRIYEVTHYYIRDYKAAPWRAILNTIGSVVEIEENYDSEPTSFIINIVQEMLDRNGGIGDEETWVDAVEERLPFIRGDEIGIHGPSVHRHIKIYHDNTTKKAAVDAMLRAAGFRSGPVDTKKADGTRVQAHYWKASIDSVNLKVPENTIDEFSSVEDYKQQASGD